jgi:hypothetical protein
MRCLILRELFINLYIKTNVFLDLIIALFTNSIFPLVFLPYFVLHNELGRRVARYTKEKKRKSRLVSAT